MMATFIAIFLILHGLVHAILAMVPNPNEPEGGFATFFSQSWLLSSTGLSESAGRSISIPLAAFATIGFVAAGLSLMGVLVPSDWWRTLAIVSAAISLLLLVIIWHRYLIVGVLIDVMILITQLLFNWRPEYQLPGHIRNLKREWNIG